MTIEWLRGVIGATRSNALVAVAFHRICSQRNGRQIATTTAQLSGGRVAHDGRKQLANYGTAGGGDPGDAVGNRSISFDFVVEIDECRNSEPKERPFHSNLVFGGSDNLVALRSAMRRVSKFVGL